VGEKEKRTEIGTKGVERSRAERIRELFCFYGVTYHHVKCKDIMINKQL